LPLPALVVADVHNRIDETEALIARHAADGRTVIFLGDYFDSYGGSPMDAHCTARWLKRSLALTNRVHLLGNHDASYFFQGHPQTPCMGWSEENQKIIEEVFRDLSNPRTRLQMAVSVGPWLISHAGFSGRQFRGVPTAALLAWAEASKAALVAGKEHPLLSAGLVRGGRDKRGGLLWCDFDDEFAALPGVHQLVGHTRSSHSVRCRQLSESGAIGYGEINSKETWGRLPSPDKTPPRSVNWCIDVESRACATVTVDSLIVHFEDRDLNFPAPPGTAADDELFPLLKAAGLPLRWSDVPPVYVDWADVRSVLTENLRKRPTRTGLIPMTWSVPCGALGFSQSVGPAARFAPNAPTRGTRCFR
jgi:hypothetical protein